VDEAGGVAAFENWDGPTYTDSGGFQVMSLGVGFKKGLAMDVAKLTEGDMRAAKKERLAHVDEDGVDVRYFIDGSSSHFSPDCTNSGGFQVMSLGVGFKKVLAMDVAKLTEGDIRAAKKERLAHVDEDGVDFRSFIDGSKHRFTPEFSMQIQHGLGADIMFAF